MIKKVDSNEFYNSKENNQMINEYKPFSAEQYYTFEASKSPVEIPTYNEDSSSSHTTSTRASETNTKFKDDLRKQMDKLSQQEAPDVSSSSGTTTTSSSATATSSTTTASGTVSSTTAASTAAASSGVASIAATAAVAVVAVTCIFTAPKNFLDVDCGMDYSAITVNVDKMIKEDGGIHKLSPEDFQIKFLNGEETVVIDLVGGKNTYLVTGLAPNETYSYDILCKKDFGGNSEVYYSNQITTTEIGKPKGVYDSLNNSIEFDNNNRCATIQYSIYLSDYEKKYSNSTFYVCGEEQTDFSKLKNVLYTSSDLNQSNFFSGTINGITNDHLYYYIIGHGSTEELLFSYEIDTNIPKEWVNDNIMDISEDDISYMYLPNKVNITGKLNYYDDSYKVGVYYNEYDSLNNNLITNKEATINIDKESMTYKISFNKTDGLASYDYVIYFLDSNSNKVSIYNSGNIICEASQEFSATYDKLNPSEAKVLYNSDSVEIEVDTNFISEDGNLYYKLEVLNSSNVVLGSYTGKEKATITISDYSELDKIIFKYYDCGKYLEEEYVYDTYETDGLDFGYPSVSLSDNLEFNGTNFTIEYECNMIYEYSNASLSLDIIDGAGKNYTKNVDVVSSNGTVILDCISGEIGHVDITPKLTFVDNTSSAKSHTITINSKSYDMSYSFEVTTLKADVSGSKDTIPITMNFSYVLPTTYSISITDSTGMVDINIPIDEEYYFDSLNSGDDSDLVVQVKDESLNDWGPSISFNISKSAANASYVSPTMNCTNPGDAVVTYNEDGTINIYRYINFLCDNENVYYNAFIYNSSYTDSETGREIFSDCYDSIGTSEYSIIENIPDMNYYFRYYTLYDYNNVTYVMYEEWPSGGIESLTSTWTTASASSGQTTIIVSNVNGLLIDNKIIIEDQEYQYTTYNSATDTEFTLVLDGELDITFVTIYASDNYAYYDDYSVDIELKGSKYKKLTYAVTSVSS